MKTQTVKFFTFLTITFFLSNILLEFTAYARAGGGGRSIGNRGSRSDFRPASPRPQPAPSRHQSDTSGADYHRPVAGGFLKSVAGGVVGGLLGGMLWKALGFGGMGGGVDAGGGIPLLGILLLAGIGFIIYRSVKKSKEVSAGNSFGPAPYRVENVGPTPWESQQKLQRAESVDAGLREQRDLSFDEHRNQQEMVMDNFFKVQGAWMNRDLSHVAGILTDQMRTVFQTDIDKLLNEKQINRLENIAVRKVEIVEAWQESGQDYISTLISANLLDYTTDESGLVLSGSKIDPIKFEEYWTFTRPLGKQDWKLSAIDQHLQ